MTSQQAVPSPMADEVEGHNEEHAHKTTLDRLIYMANQIGWFFKSQPEHTVVPGILDHIQHFWDPRMRAEIFRYIDEKGDEGRLEPAVLDALTALKLASEAKTKTRGEAEKVDTGISGRGERMGEAAAADQQGAQASPASVEHTPDPSDDREPPGSSGA